VIERDVAKALERRTPERCSRGAAKRDIERIRDTDRVDRGRRVRAAIEAETEDAIGGGARRVDGFAKCERSERKRPRLIGKEYSTLPRSSIETRRLTRTFLRAMRRAPVARLIVTIAGKSWGVRLTAIASAKSEVSRKLWCSNVLTPMTSATTTVVTRTSSVTTLRKPF